MLGSDAFDEKDFELSKDIFTGVEKELALDANEILPALDNVDRRIPELEEYSSTEPL